MCCRVWICSYPFDASSIFSASKLPLDVAVSSGMGSRMALRGELFLESSWKVRPSMDTMSRLWLDTQIPELSSLTVRAER